VAALGLLVDALGNDGVDVMPAAPGADRAGRVAAIAHHTARSAFRGPVGTGNGEALHKRDEDLALVDLAGRHAEGADEALAVTRQVELRADPTPGTPQAVVGRLAGGWFFSPPRRPR
jgi:hypothetical protein